MGREDQYQELFQKRKNCRLCKGLTNPATFDNGRFDSNQIGPWSIWQHNLNANIVIVGQDWGDTRYFEKWSGRDQNDGNPTNDNLVSLLKSIGVMIGKPRENQTQGVFLTNLILCLKTGGLQAPVADDWFRSCTKAFFKPLIDIIKPRAVLALGKKTSEFILNAFGVFHESDITLKSLMEKSPYSLSSQTVIFPLYHCGAGSINRNRSFKDQLNDWQNIYKKISKK